MSYLPAFEDVEPQVRIPRETSLASMEMRVFRNILTGKFQMSLLNVADFQGIPAAEPI